MKKLLIVSILIIGVLLTGCNTTAEVEPTPTATPEIKEGAFIDFDAPIGIVAGHEISWSEFVNRVQFQRLNLINSYVQYSQMLQTVEDPELQIEFVNYLNSLEYQLDIYTLGSSVLNDIAGNKMLQQQAEGLGYFISEEDIDKQLEKMFGYGVKEDTKEEISLAATPTPYTYEMYRGYLEEYLDGLNQVITFSEDDLRALVKEKLYETKIMEYLDDNLNRVQEKVHAKHILVETEEQAIDLFQQLESGADWDELASEHSLDTGNKDMGGDLGWFSFETMVEPFSKVAFDTDIDGISEPVETQFGWHLIYVLGHEEQEMSEQDYLAFRDRQLAVLMEYARNSSGIEFVEGWENYIPDYPQIPEEFKLPTQ